MAGTSKKNSSDPVLLLLAIPVAIFMFLKEHIWIAVLIGVLIIAAVVGVNIAKKKNFDAFLRNFYDRNRGMAQLNADSYIDLKLTEAIINAMDNKLAVTVGKKDPAFQEMLETTKQVFLSQDAIHSGTVLSCLPSKTVASTINNYHGFWANPMKDGFGIEPACDPIIIRSSDRDYRGYVFYVFPETVLAFLEGPEQVVFVAAYKPEALALSSCIYRKNISTIVYEKSQKEIRYYDRFCPVKDAPILSSKWEVTNQDGSRSFKGGLLPEHNPLHFELKYGTLAVRFGDYSVSSSFSRFDAVARLTAMHSKYNKQQAANKQTSACDSERQALAQSLIGVITQKMQDDTFSSVPARQTASKDTPEELPSVFLATNTTSKEDKL